MKKFNFVTGLPRSGATMVMNILNQNNVVHTEPVSSLYTIIHNIHHSWSNIPANIEHPSNERLRNVLEANFEGYYKTHDKEFIFDKNVMWTAKIDLLEAIFQTKVKMLCMVRNPAEILTSFERIKRRHSLDLTLADSVVGETSTVASRAYYYAGPTGAMGSAFNSLKDAVTQGYLDRLLFVEYNKFCNNPKAQMRRIYDFFEIPSHEHDFNHIAQKDIYVEATNKLPRSHVIKPFVERTTVNCVNYLGLDLFNQFNRDTFWDAWV
jgi:sulfotransferase